MGLCLCLSKSNVIIGKKTEVEDWKNKPYRWAVINPRPAKNGLMLDQVQAQPKQVPPNGVKSEQMLQYSSRLCLKSELHYPLTCLDMLKLSANEIEELEITEQNSQQKQEAMSTKSVCETAVSVKNGVPESSLKRVVIDRNDRLLLLRNSTSKINLWS
jgi:hypothetical protein